MFQVLTREGAAIPVPSAAPVAPRVTLPRSRLQTLLASGLGTPTPRHCVLTDLHVQCQLTPTLAHLFPPFSDIARIKIRDANATARRWEVPGQLFASGSLLSGVCVEETCSAPPNGGVAAVLQLAALMCAWHLLGDAATRRIPLLPILPACCHCLPPPAPSSLLFPRMCSRKC